MRKRRDSRTSVSSPSSLSKTSSGRTASKAIPTPDTHIARSTSVDTLPVVTGW